jgi:hypothetical protein
MEPCQATVVNIQAQRSAIAEGQAMTMRNVAIRNVGAIDPTLETSPIAEETAEEAYTLSQQAPDAPVCYFNGEVFRTGELVRSGSVILKCRNGLWMEAGPADPSNP